MRSGEGGRAHDVTSTQIGPVSMAATGLPYPQLAPMQARPSLPGPRSSAGSSSPVLSNRPGLFGALARRSSKAKVPPRAGISSPVPESVAQTGGYTSSAASTVTSRSVMGPRTPTLPRPDSRTSLSTTALSYNSRSPPAVTPPAGEPIFEHQLRRLEEVLPQASRDELTRYLRRAGNDIDAISLYLAENRD